MSRSLSRAAFLFAVLLVTCRDDPAGPPRGGPGYVAVQPVFSSAVDLASFGLTADTVRVVVVRFPADTLRVLTVFFDPDSSEIRLAADVVLRVPVETLTVHLELRGGGFALFSGTRQVEVRAGRPGATPPQEIPVTYTGPGGNIATVTIAPRDTVLSFGGSFRFRVTALDSGGAPVAALYVAWRTSDTSVMRVNAAGLARAPNARAMLYVQVRTPTGVGDSTPVTVIPVPTGLAQVRGSGQSAVVGTTLLEPLQVRVTAADGLGVKGIPVRFRAPTGGAVTDSLVVSDTGGYAQTPATLGIIAGSQSFDATASALAPVTFRVTATPDAASPATSIVSASAAGVLSGASATLTLVAKDQFGNNLATGGLTVAFAATGGVSTGAISGTTDHGDGSYTATFTGLRAGTPTTISATIGGTPVMSLLPTIAVSPGAVAQVLLVPPAATLGALGISQQFSAVAQDANGNAVPGQTFSWRSAIPGIATVDGAGRAIAIGNGTTTITATTVGIAGSASVTVAQVVASIVVSPASAIIAAVGGTVQFAAVARDARGNVIPGQGFAWSSSAPSVAGIDATGLATGVASGSATVTATTGAVSGTATLSVAQIVSSVVISPASATLNALGLVQRFTAVAQDANGNLIPDQTFSWTSSASGVAAVDPPTGLVTAVGNGAATITATTGGVSATVPVTVAQTVASVRIGPVSAALDALGRTQQFTAQALDANGYAVPGQTFGWASSATGVAIVDAVTGLATAVGNGTATIAATTGGVSGTALLSVAQVVTSVLLSPASAILDALGLTQQFTAVARDANGNVVPGRTFTWTSSAPAVVSIAQTGLATGLAIGAATIRATTGGVTGTATLSIAQTVASVEVTPATAVLDALGLTQRFTAVAKDATGNVIPGRAFTWGSTDTLVGTVDPSGLVTTVGNGAATITATTGGVTGTATLSVAQIVRSVVLSPPSATLGALLLTQQFTAGALDGNGRAVAGRTFAWSSSNPTIASVDAQGLATGLAAGAATITASTGGASGTAMLSVAQIVASVVVTPAAATLDALGLTQRFTAVAQDASGNAIPGRAFAWTSSDGLVATVDSGGLVTAVGNGPATITATTGGISGTASLSIAQIVKSVVVSPASAALDALGLAQPFSAVALDGNGRQVGGRTFTWTSSDGRVVTVDPGGLATAVGNGAAVVTATTGAVSGTAALSVAQVVRSIVVNPVSATLNALGFTAPFSAVARDANGHDVAGQAFAWRSSATGVATVDAASGLATAVGNGSATILATAAGVTGSASLLVSQVVVQVDVSPAAATLNALALTQQFTATARDAGGMLVAGRTFSWTSSAPGVATVDAVTGLATAITIGTATITATTGGVSGAGSLTVVSLPTPTLRQDAAPSGNVVVP
jgi:uncharacterized protein YjdB